MQEELEKIKAQAEEYLAGWKRAKADFVNYQKQVEKEKAEWLMFASAGCVKAMLPVLDSLEAACQVLGVRGEGSGVENVRDQMVEALKSMGVEAIPVTKEPSNPELHEVVGTEQMEEVSSGLMAREVQRGYTLHGKVLRPAKVIVAK